MGWVVITDMETWSGILVAETGHLEFCTLVVKTP